ncbi:MAG: MlaD family protein [Spongiibacteraceae bacterium]
MSRSANPLAVGAFILGSLLLTFFLLLFFTGSSWLSSRENYVLLYDTSIKGLNVGAPVTIKGVKIGQVIDIKAGIYGNSMGVLNTVTLEIDTKTLEVADDSKTLSMEALVERGLRAQLRLQSLLTGLLYVDVDFHPDKIAQYKNVKTRYKQLPTTPTDLEQLTRDLEAIDVNKLGQDLQQIVGGINQLVNDPSIQHLARDLGQTVTAMRTAANDVSVASKDFNDRFKPLASNANDLVVTLNNDLPQLVKKLDGTLIALEQASQSVNRSAANTEFLTSDDSPLLYRINTAANSIDSAADKLRNLSELLEREPQALIYGKQEE